VEESGTGDEGRVKLKRAVVKNEGGCLLKNGEEGWPRGGRTGRIIWPPRSPLEKGGGGGRDLRCHRWKKNMEPGRRTV